jgi:hypothetical protein
VLEQRLAQNRVCAHIALTDAPARDVPGDRWRHHVNGIAAGHGPSRQGLTSPVEEAVELVEGLTLPVDSDVPVDVRRHLQRRVAEDSHHYSRFHPEGQGERDARVPEVMQADPSAASFRPESRRHVRGRL